jgi:hypothetical protein
MRAMSSYFAIEDHLEVNQLPHIQNCVEEILGTNHSSVRSRLTPSSMDLFAVDKTATPINIERYRKRALENQSPSMVRQ